MPCDTSGRNAPVVSVASDQAPEILKAVSEVGFTSEPSIPGDPIHNVFAESAMRTVKQGTPTLVVQSGLPSRYWKWAQRCFSFLCNVTMPPPKQIQDAAKRAEKELADTRFAAHLGYDYEGYLIFLGALCGFGTRPVPPASPKEAPRSTWVQRSLQA